MDSRNYPLSISHAAAFDQYGLPYTILRPFNCVGIGERRALGDVEILSGNVRLAMSHVVPDLVQKVVKGQDPLHILGDGSQIRHYTYGADLAEGIAIAMEHPAALNEDFNLSTPVSTTVLELANAIWTEIKGSEVAFRWVSDPPFPHDVHRRVPSTEKAKQLLGFEANTDSKRYCKKWCLGLRKRSPPERYDRSRQELISRQEHVWFSQGPPPRNPIQPVLCLRGVKFVLARHGGVLLKSTQRG